MINKNVTNKFIIKMQTLSSTKRLVIINLFSFEKNKKIKEKKEEEEEEEEDEAKVILNILKYSPVMLDK